MTTASPTRAARGRRSARPSGDDREQAILATAERLLEERPFADISVDDLAKGAGLSRPTFYFYFTSKEAVLLSLLEPVIARADAEFDGAVQRLPTDPRRVWRNGIKAFFEAFQLAPRAGPGRNRGAGDQLGAAGRVVGLHAEVDRPHGVDDRGRTGARRRAGNHPGGRPGRRR